MLGFNDLLVVAAIVRSVRASQVIPAEEKIRRRFFSTNHTAAIATPESRWRSSYSQLLN